MLNPKSFAALLVAVMLAACAAPVEPAADVDAVPHALRYECLKAPAQSFAAGSVTCGAADGVVCAFTLDGHWASDGNGAITCTCDAGGAYVCAYTGGGSPAVTQ